MPERTIIFIPTERQMQDALIAAAHLAGWLIYHPWTSVHSASGWPDLFCVHPERGQALAFELKSQRGRVSAAQRQRLGAVNLSRPRGPRLPPARASRSSEGLACFACGRPGRALGVPCEHCGALSVMSAGDRVARPGRDARGGRGANGGAGGIAMRVRHPLRSRWHQDQRSHQEAARCLTE